MQWCVIKQASQRVCLLRGQQYFGEAQALCAITFGGDNFWQKRLSLAS
jgi:hypothetical protein